MATKKAKTPRFSEQVKRDGPFYVTGNTIKELRSFISELPDDMTISLEVSPHDAAPLAFDRVVTGTNHRGESEQIALFHEVTKESLGAIRAKAAAGELPKLDSTRRASKKAQTPNAAITESDKQYIRTLGLNPDTTTVSDLYDRLEWSKVPMTSQEAVNKHFAVLKRVLLICRDTAMRTFELRDATAAGK